MTDGICSKCFSPAEDDVCTFCGYDNSSERLARSAEKSKALPLMYVLQNRYILGKVIGAGGFGITYLALDIELQERVAVKEYFPNEICERDPHGEVKPFRNQKAYSQGVKQFYEEAKVLQRLNQCPSVVNVKNFFRANGTAYIVMEFIQGESIAQHAMNRGGALPWKQAKFILLQVALALSEVHSQGIIHSDISPSNILIQPDGDVKLIDFGASRNYLGLQKDDGIIALKLGFAPPEQLSGNKEAMGPWTDIYSLACTFYRMLGQVVPKAQERSAGKPLPDLRTQVQDAEPGVVDAVEKALCMDCKDRYSSVDAFLGGIVEKNDLPNEVGNMDSQTQSETYQSGFLQKLFSGWLVRIGRKKDSTENALLQVLEGDGKGRFYSLKHNQICRIGRQADVCDVVVSRSSAISRVHCVANYDKTTHSVTLYDKSRNGVSLGDGRSLQGGSVRLTEDTIVILSSGEAILHIILQKN